MTGRVVRRDSVVNWRRRLVTPPVWLAAAGYALVALSFSASLPVRPDRGTLSAWTLAVSAVQLLGPIFAAAAAWEAARLARGGLTKVPAVRPRIMLVLRLTGPLWAGATLATLAVCITFAGLPSLPADQVGSWLWLTLSALALLAALLLLGAGLGYWLPAVIAAPAALVLSYVWVAVPASLSDPPWLRHLVGVFDGCCAPAEVISPDAIVGAAVATLGLGLAGIVLASVRGAPRAAPMAAGVLVVGVLLGTIQVQTLGYRAEVPRIGDMACTEAEGLRLCVWPEHAHLADETMQVVVETAEALRAAGLPTAALVTEQRDVGDALTIALGSQDLGGSLTGVRLAFALAAHPGWDSPACAVNDGWPAGSLAPLVFLWLVELVGVDGSRVAATAEEMQAVDRVERWPMARQREWFNGVAAALTSCDEPDAALFP